MNKAYTWGNKRFTLHNGVVVSSDVKVTSEISVLVKSMASSGLTKSWHVYAYIEETEYFDPHDIEYFGVYGARCRKYGWPDNSNIWSK